MSQLQARLTEIENVENLHMLSFEFCHQPLRMMSLEVHRELAIGSQVILSYKTTNMSLAKEFQGEISLSNQLNAVVLSIDKGKLLSSVKLQCCETVLESIITTASVLRMNLQVDDNVTALLKASDLSIAAVI